MTRRKLLLWGVPAVLVLAVVAAIAAIVLIPPKEAEALRRSNQLQRGMTLEQVRDVLGKERHYSGIGDPDRFVSGDFTWKYEDGSFLALRFINGSLKQWRVLPETEPSWYEEIRQFLRKAGLSI